MKAENDDFQVRHVLVTEWLITLRFCKETSSTLGFDVPGWCN